VLVTASHASSAAALVAKVVVEDNVFVVGWVVVAEVTFNVTGIDALPPLYTVIVTIAE